MHILDQIQDIDIETGQPIHHQVKLVHHFVIIQILGANGSELRSALYLELLIHTAVDRVEQALGQVGAGSEELHLLTGLRCRYAAADGVIVSPYRLHDIVILVLNGRRID